MEMIAAQKLLLFLAVVPLYADSIVSEVRYKLSAGDLSSADAIVDEYHRAHPDDPEYAAAVGWLARGALMLHDDQAAGEYLARAKSVTAELLKTQTVDKDAYLANAVGATIEVESRLFVARGKTDDAVALLERELPKWQTFSIQARIQKNLNLLKLAGNPAPQLPPEANGKPVLLFLWAHWCSDCKAQAPVIANIRKKYAPQGFLIIAPTRRYGTVPNVDNPTQEQEDHEIEAVWRESYSELSGISHPVSDTLMRAYGVSSTPTLVLIDSKGIVRMYLPFRINEGNLERRIEAMIGR